jgi:transposase
MQRLQSIQIVHNRSASALGRRCIGGEVIWAQYRRKNLPEIDEFRLQAFDLETNSAAAGEGQRHDALSTMPVKTDRNDARGIAQLMRLGWFRPVHCKSMAAQEVRALLTARKLVQSIRHRDEPARLRAQGWANHVADLCSTDQPSGRRPDELGSGGGALLSLHAVALREFKSLEKSVRQISRADARVRLLMSTPGVGPLVALTYVAAIDDPARFTSSKSVGAHFGLTPKKYQSGETDVSGRISKMGDGSVRTALYEAAHVILTRPIKGGALKSWAMKLARRA